MGLGGIIQNGNYPGFAAPSIFEALKVISPIAYPIRNPDGTPGGAQTFIGWNPWGGLLNQAIPHKTGAPCRSSAARWDMSSFTTKGLSLRGLFSYDHYAQTNNVRLKEFEVKRYLGKDPVTNEDMYRHFIQRRKNHWVIILRMPATGRSIRSCN